MDFSGGLRLFKLFGINVYAHWSFGILLALVAWQHYQAGAPGQQIMAALHGVAFIIGVFVCVVMHEFGHALAARRYGIATRDISIQIIGGLARLSGFAKTPTQELVIAIAGPLVNVAIVAVLFPTLVLMAGWERLSHASLSGGEFLSQILWANVILVIFNMIPAFPMDGGRVLRSLIWYGADFVTATKIAARIGQVVCVGFIALACFAQTPMLALVGVFIFLAAGAELRAAKAIAQHAAAIKRLDAVTVAQAMLTAFSVVDADAPVHAVLQRAQQTGQLDFPVIDSRTGALAILHRGHLQAAQGITETTLVRDIAQRVASPATPDEPLGGAVRRMNELNSPAIPVVASSTDVRGAATVVGLLTMESIDRASVARA